MIQAERFSNKIFGVPVFTTIKSLSTFHNPDYKIIYLLMLTLILDSNTKTLLSVAKLLGIQSLLHAVYEEIPEHPS